MLHKQNLRETVVSNITWRQGSKTTFVTHFPCVHPELKLPEASVVIPATKFKKSQYRELKKTSLEF